MAARIESPPSGRGRVARRAVPAMAALLLALALPAGAQNPEPTPAAPAPIRVFQRLRKADPSTVVPEWRDARLGADALLLPTETEYNDPRQIDTLVAAARALIDAGAPELWLEIGVSGQTLRVENALTATRFYLKQLPRVRGLVVHWLFPKRLLDGSSVDARLREFASLGLPLIVMGDPESARTLTYTALDYSTLQQITKVEGIAPDVYFAFSRFALDEGESVDRLDITVVERWLDRLAKEGGLPLYPALRLSTPIDAKPLTLEEFESILKMVEKRRPAGVILEPLEGDPAQWARWREAFRRVIPSR